MGVFACYLTMFTSHVLSAVAMFAVCLYQITDGVSFCFDVAMHGRASTCFYSTLIFPLLELNSSDQELLKTGYVVNIWDYFGA